MGEIIKICKKHGELDKKYVRIYFVKGYKCKQCKLCNLEWDKKKRDNPEYKRKRLLNSQKPENREKQKKAAIAYKERRRVVALALYHKKKEDPDHIKKNKKWRKIQYERMKSGMTDAYIKKTLRIHKDAIPEMIENKRNEILEFRRLREEAKTKKQLKSELIKKMREDRENKKISGIVKTCDIHGDLYEKDCFFARNGVNTKNKIWLCRECSLSYGRSNHHKHREKRIIKQREYLRKNIEKVKQRIKDWISRAPDAYIARYFTSVGIKREQLTPEILELKRAQIFLKRKIRKNKTCQK